MDMQWKKLLARITMWLVAEIILNSIGLDNIADYSEFIFEGNVIVFEVKPRWHWSIKKC